MKKRNVLWLCESAVMIALSTVLSLVAVINMPYGGSVTAFSMVPVILIAYRYGVIRGIATGFIHGLLQMFIGFSNVSYALGISVAAGIAVMALDYLVAFTSLGLGGAFKKTLKSQSAGLLIGTLLCCAIRFLCHVISGCTVWAGVSIPTADGFIYSLVYNAAYMIPETFVTLAGVWYVGKVLDLRGETLSHNLQKEAKNDVFSLVGIALLLGAVLFDALKLFGSIQSEEGFDITGIVNADFAMMGIVTLAALVIATILYVIGKKNKKR